MPLSLAWLTAAALAGLTLAAATATAQSGAYFRTISGAKAPAASAPAVVLPPVAVVTAPTLDVSGVPLTGRVGDYYQGIAAMGGSATSLTVANTPYGIRSLGQSLSGYPTDEGLFSVTFTAEDDAGKSVSASVDVEIGQADYFTLDVTGVPLNGRVGSHYYGHVVAHGFHKSDITHRVIGPAFSEMSLNMYSDGYIVGTPLAAGSYDVLFEARAPDASIRTALRTITIWDAQTDPMNPGLIDLGPYMYASTQMRLAEGMRGADGRIGWASVYLTDIGQGDKTFSLASGSLPPGISINELGRFVGTATSTGTYTFTVRATTPTGAGVTPPFTVTVGAAVPAGIKLNVTTDYTAQQWRGHAFNTSATYGAYDGQGPYTHAPVQILSQTGSAAVSQSAQFWGGQRVDVDWNSPGELWLRACASDATGAQACRDIRFAATYTGFEAGLSFPNRNLTCSAAAGNTVPFSYDVMVTRSMGHSLPIAIAPAFDGPGSVNEAAGVQVAAIAGGYRVTGSFTKFNAKIPVRSTITDTAGAELLRVDHNGFNVDLGDCDPAALGPFTVEWDTPLLARSVGWESQLVGVKVVNGWGKVDWIAHSQWDGCQMPEYQADWSDKEAWQTRAIWLQGGRTGCSSSTQSMIQIYTFRDSLGRVRQTSPLSADLHH